MFARGPLSAEQGTVRGAREQLDQALARHPWLRPVAVAVFVGRYDPAKLGLTHTLLAALPASPLHGRPASDARDWPAIRAWAGALPGRFESAPMP